jgi:acyl-ACP thioesterase
MARIFEAGFGIVARRYRIEYQQPALFGDELELATWIAEVKRSSAVRYYAMHRASDGALVARAHVTWVWIDLKTGRPIRVPSDFMADFASNIRSEGCLVEQRPLPRATRSTEETGSVIGDTHHGDWDRVVDTARYLS